MPWGQVSSLRGPQGPQGPSGVTTLRGASDYDNSTAPTAGQAVLWVPDGSGGGRFAPRTITPGSIGAAVDSEVLHLAGTETVTGVKIFNIPPRVGVGDRVDNPVRRDDSRLTDARVPLAHAHATSDITALADFVDARTSLIGVRSDTINYNDHLAPFPRLFAAAQVGAVGTSYSTAVITAGDDRVTRCRFCTGSTAPAGTGSINVGVYVGSTPTSLTRVATATQSSAAANTLYDLALSTAVTWTAGQYVSVVILMLGFTTSPTIRCIGGGGPGSALLNPTATRMAGTAASQTALPASINLQSGWSGSGLPLWWALAD